MIEVEPAGGSVCEPPNQPLLIEDSVPASEPAELTLEQEPLDTDSPVEPFS